MDPVVLVAADEDRLPTVAEIDDALRALWVGPPTEASAQRSDDLLDIRLLIM